MRIIKWEIHITSTFRLGVLPPYQCQYTSCFWWCMERVNVAALQSCVCQHFKPVQVRQCVFLTLFNCPRYAGAAAACCSPAQARWRRRRCSATAARRSGRPAHGQRGVVIRRQCRRLCASPGLCTGAPASRLHCASALLPFSACCSSWFGRRGMTRLSGGRVSRELHHGRVQSLFANAGAAPTRPAGSCWPASGHEARAAGRKGSPGCGRRRWAARAGRAGRAAAEGQGAAGA